MIENIIIILSGAVIIELGRTLAHIVLLIKHSR
jgi:hypothetical protein